jgi:hypothetical protein
VKGGNFLWLILVGAGLLLLSGGGFSLPSISTKATAVTYVHEQRSGSITPSIRSALSTLNDKGVNANEFDQDTVSKGGGNVPAQYVVPLAAAKKVGLPAVVSTAGERVLKTIKDPKAEDILALAP